MKKGMSIEKAFELLKTKKYIIYRESWLKGDHYYINDEDILCFWSSSDKKTKMGILSFLNPLFINDWIAENKTQGDS